MLPDTFRSEGGQNFQSVPTDVDGVLDIESICNRIEIVSAHKYMRVGLG